MAMTLRLPPELHARATACSTDLGISLNALLALALRAYLDGQTGLLPTVAPLKSPGPVKRSSTQVTSGPALAPVPAPSSEASKPAFKRPKEGASAPCPCGAKSEPYGYPVKWKHCHGKP